MFELLFTHKRDCDGLMSGAIYLRANPGAKIFFIDYYEEDIERTLRILNEHVSKGLCSSITIADFGPIGRYGEKLIEALINASTKGIKVTWIDHHQWPAHLRERLSKHVRFYIDISRTSSEIMNMLYGYREHISEYLALIGRDTDLNIYNEPISRLLTDLIVYYCYLNNHFKLTELVYKLSRGVLWDVDTALDYKEYVVHKGKAISELSSSIREFLIGNYCIRIGLASKLVPYNEGLDIIMKDVADIGVIVYDDGSLILRRKEGIKIKCNEIAALFGGGGHEYVGGGLIPKSVKSEEWITYIVDTIESYVSSLASP